MEAVCGQRGYFTTTENPKGAKGHEYEYTPGPNAEAGRAAGLKRLGVHATAAAALLRVIRGMTTDEAELFATVHAVWNDLLIDGKPPDESAIVKGVHAWNPSKRKFSETTIVECIAWIRTNGYVPTGRGKRTVEAKPSVKRAGGDCG